MGFGTLGCHLGGGAWRVSPRLTVVVCNTYTSTPSYSTTITVSHIRNAHVDDKWCGGGTALYSEVWSVDM